MKILKAWLMVLLGASIAYSWWGAAVFGRSFYGEDMKALWIAPAVLTFFFVLGNVCWIIDEWDEK